MNKKQLIKLIIFSLVIVSHILPMRPTVTNAQAKQCCTMNCGKNVKHCPMEKKSKACHKDPMQCCKDNCLKPFKSKILLNKGSSFQKFSWPLFKQVPFSYFQIALVHHSLLFYQSVNYQKNKFQNLPLFQINSVYLI